MAACFAMSLHRWRANKKRPGRPAQDQIRSYAPVPPHHGALLLITLAQTGYKTHTRWHQAFKVFDSLSIYLQRLLPMTTP